MTSTAPTAVAAIIDDLSYAYDGVFDKEAVTDAVTSAWDLLSPRSSVRTYLPILVARQAREQLMAAAQADGRIAKKVPELLFVCVHNAGRSQMAAGWLRELAGDRVEVRSAGSIPADQINSVAVEAMREVGIDITAEQPKVLTTEAVQDSDMVITMGCGDACPFFPGKRYEDWKLDDPAGQGIDAVRPIRDDIRARIEGLITSLTG